jgi:hypothetical protein
MSRAMSQNRTQRNSSAALDGFIDQNGGVRAPML